MSALNATISDAKTALLNAIAELGLAINSEFVPFSQSRNKAQKYRSLNWRVTLTRNGREVVTTDYSAGVGHCSDYTRRMRPAYEQRLCEEFETEKGKEARMMVSLSHVMARSVPNPSNDANERRARPMVPKLMLPDTADVVHSLIVDASVLDSSGFESWAADFGYDTDSREAEKTYRACLEIALKIRAGIGEHGLEKLRNAAQDY